MPDPVANQNNTNAETKSDANPNPTLLGAESVPAVTPDAQTNTEQKSVDGDTKSPEQQKTEADKATADKAEADKKGESEKAKVVPEKYEFKAPEGVQLDPEGLTKLESLSKELGLSQEAAQKVLDLGAAQVQKISSQVKEENNAQWQKARDGWIAQIKADPDLGGSEENFKLSNEIALRAVRYAENHGAGKDLKAVFNSGWGDHPALFRAFKIFGDALGEDRTIDGDPTPMRGTKSPGEVIYGKK